MTGIWPYPGIVAVDPRVIALHSTIRIEGLAGTYTAEDTGGAVVGAHVDVFVTSDTEAYRITRERRVWLRE